VIIALRAYGSAFGRLGQPTDIEDVVVFLVSEQARWLTEQNIQDGWVKWGWVNKTGGSNGVASQHCTLEYPKIA
jgi:NAD(P)-dependent dehydrogenase (short-subunit alcohol dehydrogenase family)